MRISGHQVIPRPASVRAQAQAQTYTAPAARPHVQSNDGPPPEYSLWAMLKDIGQRLGNFFRNLF